MLWEDAIASIAPALGMTTIECAMIFGLILTIFLGAFLALITQKFAILGLSVGIIFGTIFFTFAGWIPMWSGTGIAFAISIVTAYLLSSYLQGGK